MPLEMILTGDINLMGMEESAAPFARISSEFHAADAVFGNLECCLYDPPRKKSASNPAFYAPSTIAGNAIKEAGVHAVGMANNVNFGEEAIASSTRRLDELGIRHTGAGADLNAARAPATLNIKGVRIGFLQRTSVYWAANHEAQEDAAGVAVIRGHTAYELPLHRETQPMNRPGVGPIIRTWADTHYLQIFKNDLAALREHADIVVGSFHWGVGTDVLEYMVEIAHAAVDSGADVVIGHGPHHHPLPIEIYKGKPIFYGLGPLAFHTGHVGRTKGWTGIFAKISFSDVKTIKEAAFRFVHQDDAMQIIASEPDDEREALQHLSKLSQRYGTQFEVRGNKIVIMLT
jgi:poly-gamma-glutamate capsule biosynthesis protein CapA/YwtB (metallophosphatase superfamily)